MGARSMEDIIEKSIEDDSDRHDGIIRFIVRCGCCDEIWHSKPWRFSLAGTTVGNSNKQIVYEAKWKREWMYERTHAVAEALKVFNFCPICERLSCEKCFRVCDTIDMCASCAQRLGESGEPACL